ncbi:hypothetical protein [Hydrocarboniphaga sp.]|uniref:hypothetical protein n=1 Tax=Hydrocarboniphaga sp. TaxID=2033016 RepID=UPI003D0A3245
MDLSGVQILKDFVDLMQPDAVNRRPHFALNSKCHGLLEIQTGTDDGAPNRQTLQHDVEDRGLEPAGGKPCQADRAVRRAIAKG